MIYAIIFFGLAVISLIVSIIGPGGQESRSLGKGPNDPLPHYGMSESEENSIGSFLLFIIFLVAGIARVFGVIQ